MPELQGRLRRRRCREQGAATSTRRSPSSRRRPPLPPNCHDCYYNIGFAYAPEEGLRRTAEAAYKKAIELKPDYVEAWNALATSTTAEEVRRGGRSSERQGRRARRRRGGGGGNAEALYNQGVILWNQRKIAEAKDKFEAATKADPKHGEAHYRLGDGAM